MTISDAHRTAYEATDGIVEQMRDLCVLIRHAQDTVPDGPAGNELQGAVVACVALLQKQFGRLERAREMEWLALGGCVAGSSPIAENRGGEAPEDRAATICD